MRIDARLKLWALSDLKRSMLTRQTDLTGLFAVRPPHPAGILRGQVTVRLIQGG